MHLGDQHYVIAGDDGDLPASLSRFNFLFLLFEALSVINLIVSQGCPEAAAATKVEVLDPKSGSFLTIICILLNFSCYEP